MGTRGLTGFIINGEVKAAYQQFDSYPSGVGVNVLHFLRPLLPVDFENMRRKAQQIVLVDSQATPTTEHIAQAIKGGCVNEWGDDSERFKGSDYYGLLRSNHGNPAGHLRTGLMTDDAEFAKDSLFCEWAYLINLDDLMLEVYEGFNTEPVPAGQRFADMKSDGTEYYPIKMVGAWSLGELPSDEQFINALEPREEEGDAA